MAKCLVLASLLVGCAVGPDFKAPPTPQVSAYTRLGDPHSISSSKEDQHGLTQEVTSRPVARDWWTQYHSSTLNQWVEAALKQNPSVEALQETLQSALQTALAQERSLLLPTVNANLTETRQRFNPQSFGSPQPPSIFSLTNASLGVSYTLDIFGGARRQIEAAYAQAELQRQTYEAAKSTLVANVVTTAIRRAAVKKQIDLTLSMIDQQQQIYTISEQRFTLGALSSQDLALQKEQLAALKATLPALNNQYSALDNQLAVYLGVLPADNHAGTLDLSELTLPKELPLSIPSELVHQRPDILAAEAQLHYASAEVGVALSGEYPTITLNGSLGSLAANPGLVFTRNSAVWSLASGITQPIFHGGALEAQTAAANSQLKSAALQYQQTVLNAFQNVADSISALQSDAQYLDQTRQIADAAEEETHVLQTQYDTGSSSYLQLLNSQIHRSQVEMNLIQAKASRLNDTAAFFLALGGGLNTKAQENMSTHLEKRNDQ